MEKTRVIFKSIVGSQAFGTATPTSDVDYKSIYMQDADEILGFDYQPQTDFSKDDSAYEVRRFLELLQVANPGALELLYMPEDCILIKEPSFDLIIENRNLFLTKKCLESFGGYAVAQIKKAKGLDKKMNWENKRIARKTPLDFCYVYENGKTLQFEKWLQREKKKQEWCGLVALNHFKDCYAIYYDYNSHYGQEAGREYKPLGYKGVVLDNSNSVRVSSVPKESKSEGILYYNKDGYSMHCKDFREYNEWLEKRNTNRYVDTAKHGQKLDGKNMSHCRRLLDVSIEIAAQGTINVRRPNAEYLLSIKRGEVDLETIIKKAESDISSMKELYAESNLPDDVEPKFVNDLLLKIRHFYD